MKTSLLYPIRCGLARFAAGPARRALALNSISSWLCLAAAGAGWIVHPGSAAAADAASTPAPNAPASAKGAASTTVAKPDGEAQLLFDGLTLDGWQVTDFAGHGVVKVGSEPPRPAETKTNTAVKVESPPRNALEKVILLDAGASLTGIGWTNPIPKSNYEISLEAMKVDGSDFFCGLTFPVKESHCSFIVGGWGGGVVGLSSVDGFDASENETTKYMAFDSTRWYKIRVRVTDPRIECWIDEEKMVDLKLQDRKISLRFGEIELSRPLGIAAWQTSAALRNIQLRTLAAKR